MGPDTDCPSGIGEDHARAIIFYPDVRSSVSCLLYSRRPSAIARLIVAVVVDPVERQAGRLLPHVFEEVGKTPPPFAHGDSSVSIEAG
jgi:hypothetical protein